VRGLLIYDAGIPIFQEPKKRNEYSNEVLKNIFNKGKPKIKPSNITLIFGLPCLVSLLLNN
jgi:hypothetical protein